jgi:diacylglycerol kinase family enzyme
MRKWLAIANPCAGAFRYGHFRTRWLPQVARQVAEVKYTEAPGQAAEIARSAGDYEGIVIIGGDGTIFEVLGALEGGEQRLALIPAGRGNCLALDLGVNEVPVAIDAIANGQPVRIDLLELEVLFADGRRHACRAASTLATGYVADVVRLAGEFTPLGRHAYTAAAVCSRPRRLPVVADYGDGQRFTGEVTGIVINNTRHLANFRAFPRASLTDGLADVLELQAGWAGQLVHNLSVLTSRYFYQPGREFRTRQVQLKLPTPDTLMVDGELFEEVTELCVTCRPAAVRVQCAGEGVC